MRVFISLFTFQSHSFEQANDTNLEELLLSSGLAGPAISKEKKPVGAFASSRAPDPQSKTRPVTPKVLPLPIAR